jgi:hypothetical protein
MLQLGQRPAAQLDTTPQVLFSEARRRRRRRWLVGGAVVLLLTAMTAAFALTWAHRMPGGRGGARSAGAASAGEAASAPAAIAVWSDGTSLLTGDIEPGGSVIPRVVAEANVGPLPLLRAGQRVYWVDPAGAFVPGLGHWSQLVRYLDLATGKIATAGPGQTVFLSADGRYLLMSQTGTSLTQTPVTGGSPRTLTLPPGWYLPGGDGLADVLSGAGLATANGILVQSGQSPGPSGTVIGLWNPAGHRVAVIGRAQAVIGAYTPPGAGRTLLAWLPAVCTGNCPVQITDTATMATRSVRSPLGHGFAMGGAFSPDGTRLALFGRVKDGSAARLALVNLAAGTVRTAREPRLALGMDIAWARWLPDGRRLVMGPASTGGYLTDTETLSAEPLVVVRGHGQHRASNQDPNYTTVLAPPPR